MTPVVQADRWRRLGRALAIIGTFVAAGPLIGLITFAAAIAGYGLITPKPGDYAAGAAAVLVYGLFFAHFMGAVPAFLTGSAAAAFAAWRGIVPVWAGALAGGAASAFILSPDTIGNPADEFASAVVWLIVATGMISGAVCTRLTRRWH